MIRSLWVWLNALVATLVVGPIVIGGALLRVRSQNFYDWAPRAWASWILWSSGVPVRVEGLERLHLDEPEIFVSNHVSWFDVFVLASVLPKRYRFVAKKELERVPVFGPAWKAAGHISIDRSDRASAIRSLDQAGRTIKRDTSSVVIFPEGTRSDDGSLQTFKKGAFMLALHARVEVVPVAIVGTRDVLPKGSWRVRRLPVIVRFGEPIDTHRFADDERDRLIEVTRSRIQAMLESPDPARIRRGR